MVELAHFATFVFGSLKKLILTIFESSFVKEFMTLIRAFFLCLGFILQLHESKAFCLRELLQLDIRDLSVVQVLVQEDVEVGLWSVKLLLENGFHLIRDVA